MVPSKRQAIRLTELLREAKRANERHRDYQSKLLEACTHNETVTLCTEPRPFCRCLFCGKYRGTGEWCKGADECPHPEGYRRDAGQMHHGYGKYVAVKCCGVCSKYTIWGSSWSKEFPSMNFDD